MKEMKIGFIGLGAMGKPMAKNLIRAGFRVIVYNRTIGKTKEFREMGASVAVTPKDLASDSQVVIVNVSNSPDVEEVLLGKEGAIHGCRPGTIVIDMGTSYPSSTLKICKILQEKGVEMLDAPVSGGVKGAEDGTLSIMVGGRREIFEKCKPILSAMGKNIFYQGESGSGHITKAINNFVSAAAITALTEALVMAKKAGLSPMKVLDVLKVSSGRSYQAEQALPQFVLTRKFDAGFLLGLMKKDLNIFASLGDDYQTPMFLGNLVHQLWDVAAREIGPQNDYTKFVGLYETWANAKVEG